jgi:hypothetical protein
MKRDRPRIARDLTSKRVALLSIAQDLLSVDETGRRLREPRRQVPAIVRDMFQP